LDLSRGKAVVGYRQAGYFFDLQLKTQWATVCCVVSTKAARPLCFDPLLVVVVVVVVDLRPDPHAGEARLEEKGSARGTGQQGRTSPSENKRER
jgi:hypothetical protein